MQTSGLKISIDLVPQVSRDEETGQFIAKFDGLPTIAFDETAEKAVLRLISIFEVFLREQKEIVFDRLIKKHLDEAIKEPSYRLVQISDEQAQSQMKLQLVS